MATLILALITLGSGGALIGLIFEREERNWTKALIGVGLFVAFMAFLFIPVLMGWAV